MLIRNYHPSDCEEMAELFYNTVHTINAKDYTNEQLNVWASSQVDLKKWNQSFLEHYSVVAVEGKCIIGFGDIDKTGYLDRLYVHSDYQKQGVATAICDALEQTAHGNITTHASITARPFFEKRGYKVVKEQQVKRQEIPLTNFVMEKEMTPDEFKKLWKKEEETAHIHGWDFSHIHNRYREEDDLPWDYEKIIRQYLSKNMKVLDYDTGGGEFLLTLNHPFDKTAATEGYPPNIELCKKTLLPLGIDFKSCNTPSTIPFESESFDIIINRHGDFHAKELYRLLKKNGLFITEQVGGENDRDLVEMVLPNTEKPFPHLNLAEQRKIFEDAGFHIIEAEEAYRPIIFYDVGAFVWFAHIIEWEFPGFSVEKCFDALLKMQKIVTDDGCIKGTIHRYLLVAKKQTQ